MSETARTPFEENYYRLKERVETLEGAIRDIWDKATPYGPGIEEAGEQWVDKYLIPAGPLHRAKGLLG